MKTKASKKTQLESENKGKKSQFKSKVHLSVYLLYCLTSGAYRALFLPQAREICGGSQHKILVGISVFRRVCTTTSRGGPTTTIQPQLFCCPTTSVLRCIDIFSFQIEKNMIV